MVVREQPRDGGAGASWPAEEPAREPARERLSGRGFLRALLRYGAISSLIGIGIQVFNSLDAPQALHPRALLAGALLGFFLSTGSLVAEALLLAVVPADTRRRGVLLPLLAYFLGGMAGCAVAMAVSQSILGYRLFADYPDKLYTLLVFGGLSGAIGLTFMTIARLRHRLEQSVAELKEREFAAKELETAREIQQRLLPPPDSRGVGYRIAARNRAARIVGGDFYDVFRLGDGSLGLAVADVAGKGLGASLIMASVKAMLPLVAADRGVGAALRELNLRLQDELGPREFVALAYARFEPASGRLELANAGLPDPLLLGPGGALRELEVPGPRLPLGVRAPIEYDSLVVELAAGERLLLYTDGLVEVRDSEDLLGFERLRSLVAGVQDGDPSRFLDEVLRRIVQFADGVLEDDCTALVLEREGGASAASGADLGAA